MRPALLLLLILFLLPGADTFALRCSKPVVQFVSRPNRQSVNLVHSTAHLTPPPTQP